MAKSKKTKKTHNPGYFCVTTKAPKKGQSRCMHKATSGKTKFVKSGNIGCPSKCRKSPKK